MTGGNSFLSDVRDRHSQEDQEELAHQASPPLQSQLHHKIVARRTLEIPYHVNLSTHHTKPHSCTLGEVDVSAYGMINVIGHGVASSNRINLQKRKHPVLPQGKSIWHVAWGYHNNGNRLKRPKMTSFHSPSSLWNSPSLSFAETPWRVHTSGLMLPRTSPS